MRILWLRPDKPDNISVGRHRIADYLRERGHTVTVWNSTLGDFVDVLRESPDVVIGTTRLGAMVGSWRKVLRHTPFVVDHIDPISQFNRKHGPFVTIVVGQIEELTFRLADHVMVVYEEELTRVRQFTDSYTKTHLGVDYEMFAEPNIESIEEARQILADRSVGDRKRVIYIGGLEPAYNVPAVIEAMSYLSGWEFIVLGAGTQRKLVERADGENIHYLGSVSHELIPGFLHESDVGICLLADRNTLKILEYGAAGLPAVSLKGDVEERFGDLLNYCDLNPRDIADAIEAADKAASNDEFQAFTREYSWQAVADDYEAALHRVCGSKV